MVENQELRLKFAGLYTSTNQLSAIPDGAMQVADNVVINRPGVVESRRGFKQYGSTVSDQINKIFNYKSDLIINYDSKMAYDSDGYGTWVDYTGTYDTVSPTYKMRSLETTKNFYFTTSDGGQKLDSLTSQPRASGVVEALDGTGVLTGGSGFLVADSAVAYRITWSYTDLNNNLHEGPPSSRLIIENTTGTDANTSLTYLIPDTITTQYQYNIYRSFGTATAADEPTDELQLVVQNNPTPTQITAGIFTVTDNIPYALMGLSLYTNPGQEGILQANFEPPLSYDMDVFKNCVFYVNTEQKQSKLITLISAGLPGLGFLVDTTVGTDTTTFTLSTISSTTNLRVGMSVIGLNIPGDTFITAIASPTTVTINKHPTATGTSAVTFADIIFVENIPYYAVPTPNNPSGNQFFVQTTLTPGDNITQTAQNFISVFNQSPFNNDIYAYYQSGDTDLPGKILFKARTFGLTPFQISSTAGSSFVPQLGYQMICSSITTGATPIVTTLSTTGLTTGDIVTITSSNSTPSVDGDWTVTVLTGTTFRLSSPTANVTVAATVAIWILKNKVVLSDSDKQQNRAFVSKPSQPEAVPITNFFDIGSGNYPIDRVIALRDGIFFFKEDGIYRISGNDISTFTVELVDNTVVMVCPESAVAFNNQIFCFTTQGICSVSNSGVQILSIPIEATLLKLTQYSNFNTLSFGVAYESERQYHFYTVTTDTDGYATQCFIYNYITNAFVRWTGDRTCGLVNVVEKRLFVAKPNGQVLIERKAYDTTDYTDEQFDVNIASVISTTKYTLTDVSNVVEGMTIVQHLEQRVITDITGTTITLDSPTPFFTTGAAVVFTPISNIVQWAQISGENPGVMKQFSELTFLFGNASFANINASFYTNINSDPFVVFLDNNSAVTTGWGTGAWGGFAWGNPTSDNQQSEIRTFVPKNMAMCHFINISLELEQAFNGFALSGVSLIFSGMSSRVR